MTQDSIVKRSTLIGWIFGITMPILSALLVWNITQTLNSIEILDEKVDKIIEYNAGREPRIIRIEADIQKIGDDIKRYHSK